MSPGLLARLYYSTGDSICQYRSDNSQNLGFAARTPDARQEDPWAAASPGRFFVPILLLPGGAARAGGAGHAAAALFAALDPRADRQGKDEGKGQAGDQVGQQFAHGVPPDGSTVSLEYAVL